jgi:hypothetical protein
VPSDLSRTEVREEGNLLIEAVALLVQRQRETESWVAEQIWQAEERTAATDRRYAELDARLADIEEHLARLVHEIEPPRGDPAVDERLARLRAQVEGLKSGPATEPRPAHGAPIAVDPIAPVVADAPAREPESARSVPAAEPRYQRRAVAAPAAGAGQQSVPFWDLLGPTPQDRFGLALIGAGAVAVLYAILTQLRFS